MSRATSPLNDRSSKDQLALARQAARGDEAARRQINHWLHPIITYQTNRFCTRFCHGNHHRFRCTLHPPRLSRPPKNALLCEFGNASYAWMLDDLTRPKRLLRYEARHGARLNDYLYRIANSLPFYERWKNWRFSRKAHVPTYIQHIDPDASRVFLMLRAGRSVPEIAQQLAKSESETEGLCHQIILLLTQKGRLFLLDPPHTVSLSSGDRVDEWQSSGTDLEKDIHHYDESPEQREAKRNLLQAWRQLSVLEQFVLEAMVIEEQGAEDVLGALRKLDLSIKPGVTAADTNRQQLYYFRRKTLAKLTALMEK